MNLAPDIFHFSEDYSVLEDEGARPTKVEFFQYEAKDFDFWTKDKVSRSVSRYLSSETSPTSRMKLQPHPMEAEILNDELLPKKEQNLLDFPNVFQARLIGEKSVNTLQEWECVIEDIEGDAVVANGLSLIDAAPEDNIFTIPIREFADKDRHLIAPGVIFRLIIGYSKRPSGQRIRESICYVRRTFASQHKELTGIASL